ncbi:hypothetical protein Tco_1403239 [Tanacetum coccineum]
MSENEDKYHDIVLDLEAKLKNNVDLILKLGNSLQRMFMLGPKPFSVYDQQLKHGLGYPNPYTLKQAISQCPKLYLASSLGNSEISLNVRDTKDTLDDASKRQQKVYKKMNDPIDVANKQNCWTIDYAQINALYKDFVPQKELSAEQKYFPSSFIPSDKNSNATPSIPASMPRNSPIPTPIRILGFIIILVSLDTEKLQELTDTPHTTSSSSSPHKKFMPRKSFDTLAGNLHDVMVETLLVMVDKHIKEQVMKQVRLTSSEMIKFSVVAERGIFTLNLEHKLECNCHDILLNVDASYSKQQYQLYLAMKSDPQLQQQDIAIWLALQMKFERNTVPQTACRTLAVRPRDQEPFYHFSLDKFFRGTSASTSGKSRAQTDDFDFWTDSYASDDDEIPTKQVSHDIMKEVSLTIDEAKLRKMADEMLRQRCTSGDEHQYHIDQMKEFLKE